jgi:hypothetical protein
MVLHKAHGQLVQQPCPIEVAGLQVQVQQHHHLHRQVSRLPLPTCQFPVRLTRSSITDGSTSFPTKEEILAQIPPDGVPLVTLSRFFRGRVGDKTKEFISLVKSLTIYNSETKLLTAR